MARTFDPIELELLWRRLISAVDEAAVAMVRTYSQVRPWSQLTAKPASDPRRT